MKKAQQQINVTEPSDSFNSNIIGALRARFLAGNKVFAIDYHPKAFLMEAK